ncbi:MAG: saccharopine dehydrogenase NADP-binding domain-containing protein [Salinisphaeraceae bacterium]
MVEAAQSNWMIYGCYGYTGELIVAEALARGHRPLVAGRNEARTRALADKHGLSWRAFPVEDAPRHLDGVDVFINAAGPFAATAEPLIQACIDAGVHYLDITGEIPVFQAAADRHRAAESAGIVLCPGVGFDIVPTDMLAAHLAAELPGATHLEIAFDFGSLPSQGTARTAVQAIPAGGMIRRDGALTPVPLGYRIRKVPFPRGPQSAVSFPWGDVFTAWHSTGIPNTLVYFAMPAALCWMQNATNPLKGLLGTRPMQRFLLWVVGRVLPEGPSDKIRATAGTQFWARAADADGKAITGTLTAPSVYAMTAECTVASAEQIDAGAPAVGYLTASKLLGLDFVRNRPGYELQIHPS